MGKKKKTDGFIVIYDDGMGLSMPYAWDCECEGAIEPNISAPVAMFATRAEARKAIAISRNFARLCLSQGKPAVTDFIEFAKHIHIVPLTKRKDGA